MCVTFICDAYFSVCAPQVVFSPTRTVREKRPTVSPQLSVLAWSSRVEPLPNPPACPSATSWPLPALRLASLCVRSSLPANAAIMLPHMAHSAPRWGASSTSTNAHTLCNKGLNWINQLEDINQTLMKYWPVHRAACSPCRPACLRLGPYRPAAPFLERFLFACC